MSVKYKLSFFNVTALGEPIRMLFHYGGIDFEDKRVQREEWPSLKPKMPFGQLPVLEIGLKMVNQHVAICRYIARLVKLTGKDHFEDLEIDSAVDNINELRSKIAFYWYDTDETMKPKLLKTLKTETLPFLLEKLDAAVQINKGYFVNGKLTWADVYFAGILNYLKYMIGYDLIENYPNLQTVNDNVINVPAIKKYLDNRPKTDL